MTARTAESRHALWYETPAGCFNEALPLGNGRLGAMVFGGIQTERISLNDDTLWAGQSAPEPSPAAAAALPRVRALLEARDYQAAQRLVEETMLTGFNQPYLPAGDLLIEWPQAAPHHFRRELDLDSALSTVTITTGKARQIRECFCSAADQVLVLHLHEAGHTLDTMHLRLTAPLRHHVSAVAGELNLHGETPVEVIWPGVDSRVKPGGGIRYATPPAPPPCCYTIALQVIAPGADVFPEEDHLTVRGAHEVTLHLAIATSRRHPDPAAACTRFLAAVAGKSYSQLKADHISEHRRFFHRVQLNLGTTTPPAGSLPTDRRLQRHHQGHPDPELEALLFHYGRYLLLASSRPGCQPANLQGLWNELIQPPWWSNYTININTQMNYWPAEVCNLPECHGPLFNLVSELQTGGKETARIHYGCNGWVAHHQTDFLRQTTPVGKVHGVVKYGPAKYAMWPMGGAWLCRHLWEHFLFSGDVRFLRHKGWPLMRGAAEFLLDWLVTTPEGILTTAPSTSPENSFLLPDGSQASVCAGSAMDLSIIRDLFTNCLTASARLRLQDDAFCERLRIALSQLAPLCIGSRGQIIEWDEDWAEAEPSHRHLSQLFGLYPAAEITPGKTPELAAAARRSLELRGNTGTGWSLAWKINLWARLGEAEQAHHLIRQLFNPVPPHVTEMGNDGGGLYPNLLAACPPFQIDANFGYTAGVAEMLLQSHENGAGKRVQDSGLQQDAGTKPSSLNPEPNILHLLPALPKAWCNGSVSGLRARGGITVDMAWKDGVLTSAVLRSPKAATGTVRYGDTLIPVELRAGEVCLLDIHGGASACEPTLMR